MDRLGSDVRPVVFVTAQRATALDAETGQLLWTTALDLPTAKAPLRVLRYRDDWVAARGAQVAVIDGLTGALRSRFQLGFVARTLLVQDGYLHFAGEGGTACYRDGALLWSSRHDWSQAEVVGPSGVVSRLPKFTHAAIAIGMGSVVAQAEEG